MSRIYVVEDDVDLCETYRNYLELEGHEVTIDHSGSQAISRLARFFPDLILLDMNLPGASGDIVLSYIRGHPRLKQCKVIIISGTDRNYQTRAADLFLRKPVSITFLDQAISNVLNINAPQASCSA